MFGDLSYSGPCVSRGLLYSTMMVKGLFFEIVGKIKILVVGAGVGYEVVNYLKHGHHVKALDLFVPDIEMVKDVTTIGSADNMPFEDKEFDLVHCTEMIEHIPEEMTDSVLMECKRVAKKYLISIATSLDMPYNTHINLHPAWWWLKRFEDLGFIINTAQYAPRLSVPCKNYSSYITFPDGVHLHGEC